MAKHSERSSHRMHRGPKAAPARSEEPMRTQPQPMRKAKQSPKARGRQPKTGW